MSKTEKSHKLSMNNELKSKMSSKSVELKEYKKPTLTNYGGMSELILTGLNIGGDGGPFGNNFS